MRAIRSSQQWIMLLVLLVTLIASPLWAATSLVIVRSDDSAPYLKAEEAVVKALGTQNYTLHRYQLSQLAGVSLFGLIKEMPASEQKVVFLAIGSQAAVDMHHRLPSSVTLLYTMVGNPQGLGLISGREITGITTDIEMSAQFAFIAEALPAMRNLGIIFSKNSTFGGRVVQLAKASAPAGWQITAVAIEDYESPAQAVKILAEQDVDIIWTYPDPVLFNNATVRTLLLESLRKNMPVFGFSSSFVTAGALLGVGVDAASQGAAAADLIDDLVRNADGNAARNYKQHKILSPEFTTHVNIAVMKKLDMTIPAQILQSSHQMAGGR